MGRTPGTSPPDNGTRIALGVLLGLALVRGVLAFVPSMAAWGVNVLRFVDPLIGGALWVALLAAIVVPSLRPVDSGLQRLGNGVGSSASFPWTCAIAALAAAAFAWLLPDRVQFTGDFRIREGAVVSGSDFATVFPQATSFESFLHFTVPRGLMAATGWDANAAARLLGAFDAAAFAVCALAFVHALRLAGAAAATALAVVLGGAYFGLFTGYGKAFAEMSVAAVALAAFGVEALRHGSPRALLGMGVVLAFAFALHRSGIALLPAAVIVWGLAWKAHGRRAAGRSHRAMLLAAAAIPVVAAVVFLPRALAFTWRGGDAVHLLPREAAHLGVWGAPAAALGGARLLDLANLLVFLSPLVLAMPILIGLFRAPPSERSPKERPLPNPSWLFVALAVPFVLPLLVVHPTQGNARDWDIFAPAGVVISLAVAWACGRVVSKTRSPRLARALVASAVVPALVWLCHSADGRMGLRRAEALATETPLRREAERASTWDFLAMAYTVENRWEDSARACEQAAACGRSPRRLMQWGMVESMRQNYRKAQSLYDDAVARNPDLVLGWLGLAATSSALGDTTQCKRAAGEIQRLEPHHPKLAEIERYLTRSRKQG